MPKVTEAHLEARRSQILDAAWTCFARKGYHQATMQDICQESGLSPGAIYRYFESKEAILKAINDRSQEMGRALVEEARSLAGDPLNTLEIIGQTILAYFNDPMVETTSRVNIEIFPEVIRNEQLRAGRREELTFWHRAVAQLLSEAKELGQLRPEVDPDSLAALLICAWEGIRQYSLLDPHLFRPERLIELMRALVSEGVVVEPEKLGRELTAREPLAPLLGTPFGRRSGKAED